MKPKKIHLFGLGSLVSLLLASCSDNLANGDTSVETLEAAIRAAGFPCTGAIDSSELTNEGAGWRVKCQGAIAYTANLSGDGSICVTPMPYVDAVVPPGATNRPAELNERCVSPGDI